MGKVYTTKTKILQDTSNTLKRIEQYNSDLENLKNQGASMLLTILNGTNDDAITRDDMMNCANQIYYSLKELNLINSRYYLTDSGDDILKWIRVDDINLLDYVPDIVSDPNNPNIIYGSNGEPYKSIIKDFYSCFAMLKKWEYPHRLGDGNYSKRGMTLKKDNNFKYPNMHNAARNSQFEELLLSLSRKLSSLISNKELIDSKITDLNNNIYSLQRENKKNRESITNLRNENTNLESSITNLRNENTNFTNLIDAKRNEIQTLDPLLDKDRIDILNSEIKNLESNIKTNLTNISEYNNKINSNNSKINSYNNKINSNNSKINSYNREINNLSEKLARLNQEYIEVSSQRNAIKLYPVYDYGYYYDDNFLMQRTLKKIKTEKIKILTGTKTRKGAWGKIITENQYDYIVKEVGEDERETKQDPLLPNVYDFKKILDKHNYSSKDSLIKLFNSLDYINKVRKDILPPISYLDKFKTSFNDFVDGKKTITLRLTQSECSEIYSSLPNYLFYEDNGKCAIVRTYNKKIDFIPKNIKEIYKGPYNKSDEVVRYFIYDNNDYNIYYNDSIYLFTIDLNIEFINFSESSMQKDIIPSVKINNEEYSLIINETYNKIKKIVNEAKDVYLNSPEGNRCEDYDPSLKYNEYSNSISYLPLISIEQCDTFVDYCLDTLKPWFSNRESALVSTIIDIDNAQRFLKLALKRLRKNSGTLLIWYQSLVNFDDTYISSLISKDIIKDSIKYMLVTTGCKENNEKLFNNELYPDYIDIEDPSDLYGNKKFNSGNIIYICKGIKIRENRIKNVGNIKINVVDSNNEIKKENVTRLYLENKLPSWCKTDSPGDIMVSKLL